jgi:hypothetical protein
VTRSGDTLTVTAAPGTANRIRVTEQVNGAGVDRCPGARSVPDLRNGCEA